MNTEQKAREWLEVNGEEFISESEFDAREIITALLAERELMLADLRGLTEPRLHNLVQLHLIENIINKYEVK